MRVYVYERTCVSTVVLTYVCMPIHLCTTLLAIVHTYILDMYIHVQVRVCTYAYNNLY